MNGDVVTYDIRIKKPNMDDYLNNGQLHTFEHLFATYARNTELSYSVIYVGPMGCRIGFYLLLRDNVSKERAIELNTQFQGDPQGLDLEGYGIRTVINKLSVGQWYNRGYRPQNPIRFNCIGAFSPILAYNPLANKIDWQVIIIVHYLSIKQAITYENSIKEEN